MKIMCKEYAEENKNTFDCVCFVCLCVYIYVYM